MTRISLLIFVLFIVLASSAFGIDRTQLRWARSKPVIDSFDIQITTGIPNDTIPHFKRSQIRSLLYSRGPARLRLPLLVYGFEVGPDLRRLLGDRRRRVQSETLGKDTLEIKFLYLTEGFIDVKVQEEFVPVTSDTGSHAIVRISIEEGYRHFYGQKRINGDFDDSFRHRFQAIAAQLKRGRPFNPFEVAETEQLLKQHMANRGYPYGTIRKRLSPRDSTGEVDIDFDITLNDPVVFGDVIITGDQNFPEYAARRELKIKPGETYRRKDIIDSQRRLYESGYYTAFTLDKAPSTLDSLRPDFSLRLRERKAYFITAQVGASQSEVRDLEGEASLNFGKRNLFGSRRADILADYAYVLGEQDRFLIGHEYRLRVTEPWFLGLRMPLSLSTTFQPRTKDPIQDFEKRAWSVTAELSKKFGTQIKTTFGTEYENLKITGSDQIEVDSARNLIDNAIRRKIYTTIQRDSRNDLFIPSFGALVEASFEYYGGFLGGDDSFFKLQASWSRYQLLMDNFIYATRIKAGWAEPFNGSKRVPLDEALYLGGANSVRGFAENTLGPTLDVVDDEGNETTIPAGAKITLVMNQEFRFKLSNKLAFGFPLWGSTFLDIGNGFDNESRILPQNFAVSYGLGLQVISPAGPIRVDYARVLPHDDFDFAQRWHFTILYAF